jgi:hypothetical protein
VTIRANFSGSAGVFVGRIQIAAALLPMIFGASGCRTPAPIVRRPSIETGSLGVREFSGEDRFQGYLAKLSVIERTSAKNGAGSSEPASTPRLDRRWHSTPK